MTRPDAAAALQALALGLAPTDAGVRRLLERVASADDSEALRDLLTELGARALLDGAEP